mmetsp:Transcript_16056/g.33211  ORF Transcript_16056/g.33211 Transcript_16056/m.33211 type:complete len:120 (+) Transcript_16056:251-610(+)
MKYLLREAVRISARLRSGFRSNVFRMKAAAQTFRPRHKETAFDTLPQPLGKPRGAVLFSKKDGCSHESKLLRINASIQQTPGPSAATPSCPNSTRPPSPSEAELPISRSFPPVKSSETR